MNWMGMERDIFDYYDDGTVHRHHHHNNIKIEKKKEEKDGEEHHELKEKNEKIGKKEGKDWWL